MRIFVVPVGPTGQVVSSISAGRIAIGFACRSVSTLWAASGVSVGNGGAPARPSMNRCVVGSRPDGAVGAADPVPAGIGPVRRAVLASLFVCIVPLLSMDGGKNRLTTTGRRPA